MFVLKGGREPVQMLPGIYRTTMVWNERQMLVEIRFDKDAAVPMHQHPNDQIGVVVRGLMRLTIGGETRDLRPGDTYSIPGGTPHGAVGLEQDTLIYDVFTPPREDYYPGADPAKLVFNQPKQ